MGFAGKMFFLTILVPLCGFGQQKPVPVPVTPSPSPARSDSNSPLPGNGTAAQLHPGGSGTTGGNIEVLSDTRGVDLHPYLIGLKKKVQKNWNSLIPDNARGPEGKYGLVVLRFVILPDGSVQGLRIERRSSDEPLDRAAYGAIASSTPFDPLPREFTASRLELRTSFLYNPKKTKQESHPTDPIKPEAPKNNSHPAQ